MVTQRPLRPSSANDLNFFQLISSRSAGFSFRAEDTLPSFHSIREEDRIERYWGIG